MTEQWLPIAGYEGYYEVSDQGRVRSLDRIIDGGLGRRRFCAGQLLAGSVNEKYMHVCLKRDGTTATKDIHLLVARTFIGPRPEGMEICHNNGQHHDNRVENLRYDTRSANVQDAIKHGTHYWASRTHCKNGHEYGPDTPHAADGTRRCRECLRQRELAH